ncbi:hypothetical protein N665_0285s0060 [Sinapis alba]|nr:hypothetical protein N665_0285s0060 [Sinapis alba]
MSFAPLDAWRSLGSIKLQQLLGKRRFQRAKEQSVTATVSEALSPSSRREGEEEEGRGRILRKKKVRSSITTVEEGQKRNLPHEEEEEKKKPETKVKVVAPLSCKRLRRKSIGLNIVCVHR